MLTVEQRRSFAEYSFSLRDLFNARSDAEIPEHSDVVPLLSLYLERVSDQVACDEIDYFAAMDMLARIYEAFQRIVEYYGN